MTQDNRQLKCIHDLGNNPPGLAHKNAFQISENTDVGEVNRSRKSSGAERRHREARLAPHSYGSWCRSFPGLQTPANQHHSLLVMLLMWSSTRRLARCPSRASMPRASSFRASPALFGVCVGCSLYARLSAAIAWLKVTCDASRINSFRRIVQTAFSLPMPMLMGTLGGVYWDLGKLPGGRFNGNLGGI